MKFSVLYYLLLSFFLSVQCIGQVSHQKVDSLGRAIDSSAKAMREWQSHFRARQETLYVDRTGKRDQGNTHRIPANTFEEVHKKIYRDYYLFAGLLFIILFIAIIAFRKYGRKHSS